MNKRNRNCALWLLVGGALLILALGQRELRAQTNAADVIATIQFSNGQNLLAADFSEPIAIQPSEAASITIQVDPNHAGEPIALETLDGGQISNASTTVSDDGFVTFRFQATPNAGQNRVVLRHGAQTLRLQFWVLSSQNQNPPV